MPYSSAPCVLIFCCNAQSVLGYYNIFHVVISFWVDMGFFLLLGIIIPYLCSENVMQRFVVF